MVTIITLLVEYLSVINVLVVKICPSIYDLIRSDGNYYNFNIVQ